MNIFDFGIAAFLIVAVTIVIVKLLDVKKLQVKQISASGVGLLNKKASKTQLSDYMEQLDPALDQAIKLYNEQIAVCNAEKMPPEMADKVLKPLKERIDLLQTIKKYDVIARPAAQIGDKVLNKVGEMLDGL